MDIDQQFKEYMRSRLFGIVAVVKEPDSDEIFPMCSGVIIESHGYLVLVTVAHYLRDLKRWQKQKRLTGVELIIHCEGWGCLFVKLDLTKNFLFFKEGIDIGFVVLSRGVIERIRKHGGKAIRAEAASLDEMPDNFVLVGNAATYAKLATETIASDKEWEWKTRKLDELAIAFVPLEFDSLRDDGATFKFTPITGIDDYGGTSGGPIFGYKQGALITDYRFFAIQSKQVRAGTREAKVKHLIATSAWLAVELINDHIEKLDAER